MGNTHARYEGNKDFLMPKARTIKHLLEMYDSLSEKIENVYNRQEAVRRQLYPAKPPKGDTCKRFKFCCFLNSETRRLSTEKQCRKDASVDILSLNFGYHMGSDGKIGDCWGMDWYDSPKCPSLWERAYHGKKVKGNSGIEELARLQEEFEREEFYKSGWREFVGYSKDPKISRSVFEHWLLDRYGCTLRTRKARVTTAIKTVLWRLPPLNKNNRDGKGYYKFLISGRCIYMHGSDIHVEEIYTTVRVSPEATDVDQKDFDFRKEFLQHRKESRSRKNVHNRS